MWLAVASLAIVPATRAGAEGLDLPWREAGLGERQAAAHLLDRLTFGPRPGDVDRVLEEGLERWTEAQLAASLPEPELDRRLARLPTLEMDVEEIREVYPTPGRVLVEARAAGVIGEDFQLDPENRTAAQRESRRKLLAFAGERGYRWQDELLGQLTAQKVLRAVYAENQLEEVLTDFWFNHFYVSISDIEARGFVLPYERDAIRPHVLGSFRDMLGATAKHPAMLLFLDNARSTAGEADPTTMDSYMSSMRRRRDRSGAYPGPRASDPKRIPEGRNRPRGLNENYARELLELHTLGVDGGYDQEDVVEVARAFTGWTVYPARALEEKYGRKLDRALASGAGFVAQEGFLFRADAHDAGSKTILGNRFPPGRGIEDGEAVLDLVAGHPSTARHLARKLAVRFVSDEPPESLVNRLATAFTRSDGDLERVMRSLVESPEFWARSVRGEKIKSPFELAASAIRVTGADLARPGSTVEWISRMGQPLYAYQAPTGYPDRADFWVNTGSLLNRMNFGLALAAGRVRGVELDLLDLNEGREPASRIEALEAYLPLLLPERDVEETLALLEPMVHARELAGKVAEAAPAKAPEEEAAEDEGPMEASAPMTGMGMAATGRAGPARRRPPGRASTREPTAIEQAVGVILGSPEFQRR